MSVAALDARIGASIERIVSRHHRRRLERLGKVSSLDTPAGGDAAGLPQPLAGNCIEVLVDGETALPRIADELERAESHVHLAGWFFTPEFRLRPDGPGLRELLTALAPRVDI